MNDNRKSTVGRGVGNPNLLRKGRRGSSLVLCSVTEERGGSGKRQN